ncbi:SDR family oxidoreductase [Candidatus Pelagibacter communis]|uniref:SDR family oxidoreductase n=1 Tax=Pelagibacter ubique TaxID=198252 RepID=UPI00094CCB7B|nr:SDR family oxidoreductase [Candidatus Pelagibacter ubique]
MNGKSKKKILILGSRGQIGSSLETYLKQKYIVKGIDILNGKNDDLRFQSNKIALSIKNVDFIFFLAFDVGGSRYMDKYQNTYTFIMNNLQIMSNTFALLKKNKKKFIFATSQMSNMSFSSYGILKKIGENLTSSLGGLNVRFWNVYGYETDFEKSHVITDFILKSLKTNKINMLTDGNEERDFLFIDDCCVGLEKIMIKYNKINKNEIIDMSYGKFSKIIKIAQIIKKNFFKKNIYIKIVKSKKKDNVQKNTRNIPNKKINKYWRPKISLEEGINKLINFYLSQKKYCK